MKKLFVLLALVMLLTAGCAGQQLCHPTKGVADFERDKYDCEASALQKSHDFGAAGNIFIIMDQMKKCMRYKYGWTPCP